jgi:PTH1 family peptidyl-tRNA hydrolase
VKIIVGLGNASVHYRHTRHNIGFRVVECLAKGLQTTFARQKYLARIAEAEVEGEPILLVKPVTFMNRSGACVARVARYLLKDMNDLLVIADDVNLALGKLRLRSRGSAGGHNGLKSVIEHLGTEGFPRLRMGIGNDRGPGDLTQHVLGKFTPQQRHEVEKMVAAAAEVVRVFITCGVESAMNQFNRNPEGMEMTVRTCQAKPPRVRAKGIGGCRETHY